MSHFTVLVIGDNPEKQLEKYDEGIVMPKFIEYTKEQLIKKGRDDMELYRKGTYAEYLKDKKKYEKECKNDSHMNYIKVEFPKKLKWTDEEVYKDSIQWYDPKDIGKDGEAYTTYNPDSKWDWYEIGGRWGGMLKLKEGKEGVQGKPGVQEMTDADAMKEYNEHMVGKSDQAKKGDVDFSLDEKQLQSNRRFWELYIEKQTPKNEEEKKRIDFVLYRESYYVERYKDKETYAKQMTEVGTYAVVKAGVWYSKGDMGWFGCSSETNEEAHEWNKSFFDQWIKDLPDDTLLTVVDCHI